ncbi:hypothetical protein [Edaphobacter albus]|uniref:hypothetical protein n=1 Tax=Edaphobacter sp. 4G125 TaxID=2763071 RepID=UPI001645DA76|nr:hypothetical protein [Edaphobacter sp. 4G125]QNI37193.1 hypothetical protein H7846_02350 [Edaphobacter sp. 4G125]
MAMRKFIQRLLMSEREVLPLQAQASLGPMREPERSQFAHLLRHFLERFFNPETASPDGDAKARLVQVAAAVGLPGFVVAIYLWPVYHQFIPSLQNHRVPGPPSYWLQVNHHFFFVVYSFVVMGIITVFEWDLFFPDLLDILVLKTLPVTDRRTFLARVTAIVILLGGFLFDANVFATLVLPSAIDPPNWLRFMAGHILACGGSGLFAAGSILAVECVMLSVLGERYFRRVSLFLQCFLISALLVILLLFPVFSGVVPHLLQSGSWYVRCIPPLWFLGIYQRLMEGPAALPIYGQLARIGSFATLVVFAIAVATYPLAYLRKTRQLVEGSASHRGRKGAFGAIARILHATIVRNPEQRAIFHYITQTIFRVPRYRIYLVLYGGVGLSIVVASVLRFSIANEQIHMVVSTDGLRASVGIVAFWAITGLHLAFLSPGNHQGSWIFHHVHGRPPEIGAALEQLSAAKIWAFLFVALLTGSALLMTYGIAPQNFQTWRVVTAQVLVAIGFCLLLTDLFFLHVTTIAFTGEPTAESPSLAMTVAKYFTFFPIVVWLSVSLGPWIENRGWHYIAILAGLFVAHRLIELRHYEVVRYHCQYFDPNNRENLFLLQLDLREYGVGSRLGKIQQ